MANPTTLVEQFDGDPGAFTVTGPERYEDGLWLEEGTTNVLVNPDIESGVTGWTAASGTRAQVSDHAEEGTYSLEYTAGAAVTFTGIVMANGNRPAASEGQVWTASSKMRSIDGYQITPRISCFSAVDGGGSNLGSTAGSVVALEDEWKLVQVTATAPASTASLYGTWYELTSAPTVGDKFNIDAIQVEQKPYATSFVSGTRAAASASISPAGILSPEKGSLAFRFRRKIDTGGVEPIIDCGDGTSGKDRLRVRINASDRLEMSWQTNGAAETTTQSVSTIAIDTEYLVYVGWNGIATELSIDNGTKVTGTRDTPAGSWGTAPLTLKAQ